MIKTSFLFILIKYFFFPLILSVFLTLALIKISKKLNISVSLNKDRWHKSPKSNLGGIAIFLSFLVPFLIIEARLKNHFYLLLPFFLIFTLGLLDDFFNLKPSVKLIFQIIVAVMLIHQGFFFSASGTNLIDFSLSLIWIIGITNAFNLIDNMDGLSGGIAFICGLSIFSLFMIQNNSQGTILSLILCASILGFLFFNFPPAKIFMGNSGSYFLGISFSILSFQVFSNSRTQIIPLILFLFLIFFVPTFDTLFVFIRRTFSNKLFFRGGCDHISHTLVEYGLSERKTVFLLYTVNLISCALAISLNFLI